MIHIKRKKNDGFTLIELMIVVSIIGILSSIALPQYQSYVKKAQLGAAIATIAALKINVEDYLASHGLFPNLSSTEMEEELGATASTLGALNTKATSTGTGSGQLIITLNANTQFNNKKLAFNRNTNGAWTCITDIAAGSYLPKQCTNGSVL